MVIDFHTHIFPDKIAARSIGALQAVSGVNAATDGTLDGLLKSMRSDQIDLSIILPVVTKPSQFESVNKFAASVNERYAGTLFSFGGIHPDSDNYKKELEYIKELGLKGIKIHPDYQGVMIDDIRYMNIIDYANELGLIIVTHAGIDIGLPNPVHCPPDKMRKVLDIIKPEKMILAHMGGWKQWDEVDKYLAGEKVYLDTAFSFDYMQPEVFLSLMQKHGHDRILFATDSPWSKAASNVQYLNNLNLPREILDDILSNNAKRLLNME